MAESNFGFVSNEEIFGTGEASPHFVQIARVLASERIAALEADLGHPLASPDVSTPKGDA